MGFDIDQHIRVYEEVCYHRDNTGFIVWRTGTGGNTELLHLKVYQTGQGHATALLKTMLTSLLDDPPYATVFGFTRVENYSAQGFYLAMGFETSLVRGVYNDGMAVIFSQRYDTLCEKHQIRRPS